MNEPSPIRWRKSTHSGSDVRTECVEIADLSPVLAEPDSKNPDRPQLTFHPPITWHKSTHSSENVNTECVEVADLSPVLAVRDSKNPDGPRLTFHRHEFKNLLDRVKSGRLGRVP